MSLGETLNGQRLIEFRLGQEAEAEQGLTVAAAELMVRAEATPKARRLRYTLWAFTVHGNATVGELAGTTDAGGTYILSSTRSQILVISLQAITNFYCDSNEY